MKLSSGVKLVVFASEVAASAAVGVMAGRAVDKAVSKETKAEFDFEEHTLGQSVIRGFRDGSLSVAAGLGMYSATSTVFGILNGVLGIHADVPDVPAGN